MLLSVGKVVLEEFHDSVNILIGTVVFADPVVLDYFLNNIVRR